MGKNIQVQVEHCLCAAHARQCRTLQKYIMKEQPDTDLVCLAGRRGSFEVVINGMLVHSKLKTQAFPSQGDILQQVINVRAGLPPNYVKPESACSLM
ncbi:migration and invasion enhancer 1-like [Ceratitis capitata]|uniref:migration and invasion enhancer 1-like n=1 Tax=Ceratitis capitata TaxID=7213 RepID=UPI000A10E5B8|nr:migration and invasion enhancer 1-like [Ceratitis capitata]